MDSISAIPQQPELGKLAQFLRYLETQNAPEFLPKQLDVMGLLRQLALPQASTVENLSYGNSPFTMPPSGTGAMIPQVKTGRKPEVADLIATFSGGVPGASAVGGATTKISNATADALVRAITRNPQATAPGIIQETAMPFMNAVAPKAPGLLAPRSEMGFYSALEEAVTPLQNKGTGTQFLAQLEKTPGVKPEEIKWTGLDDFLKSRQNVTKPEIENYLAQNRVNLQEVRLQDNANPNLPGLQVTKFGSYTMPGGENYREILLTLPEKTRVKSFAEVNEGRAVRGAAPLTQERYNELVARGGLQDYAEGTYKSSHFDQPNILAHMRVNDRVVDGKKTLFIEEIQSDWHQAGRKKGYKGAFTDLPEGYQVVKKQRKDAPYYEVYNLEGTQVGGGYNRQGAINGVINELNDTVGGVPDAPFKTSWHELSLKRAIQEASEKGYDKIAFTTGQTQAARYDLSKQVDELLYKKNPDGTYRLSAQVGSRGESFGNAIPESKLEDYVGKEVAKSITQGSGKNVNLGGPGSFTQPRDDWKSMSGLDLKVGGEGMKGFYDNILPKSLEKLGKKFDAKVNKTTMDGTEVWQMDITPKMRESVLTKGQPLFAVPFLPAGLLDRENQ